MTEHSPIIVRDYQPSDIDDLMALFLNSVRGAAIRDYSPEQIAAWTSERQDRARWLERRASKPTLVATDGDQIVGFTDLEPDGHIDMMFVHADHQRRGIGRKLLAAVDAMAETQGIRRLYTESSITARPLFEADGFTVITAQDVPIGGQVLRNFRMEKFR